MGECAPCKRKAERNAAKYELTKQRAVLYAKENGLQDITIVYTEEDGENTYSFLRPGEQPREGYEVFGYVPLFD